MLSPIFIVAPKRMNCKLMTNNDNEYLKKYLKKLDWILRKYQYLILS